MATMAAGELRAALRWLFVNRRTGRITVAQWPNLPLGIYLVGALVSLMLHPTGSAGSLVTWGTRFALAVWSALEIGGGVNPFRRILGAAVLASIAVPLIRG